MSNSQGLIDPDKLRAKRIRARLTQPALARQAQLDPSYVTKLEAGDRGGSPRTLGALADVLGCDITELMTDQRKAKAA